MRRLGRGLDALLGEQDAARAARTADVAEGIKYLCEALKQGSVGPPFEITVAGIPKGQPRPRAFVGPSGKARVFDAGTAEGWKATIAQEAQATGIVGLELEGPIELQVRFLLPRPKRLCRRSDPAGPVPSASKPDLDNLLKAVMDALTGVRVWRDDAQVVTISASKSYAPKDAPQRAGAVISIRAC